LRGPIPEEHRRGVGRHVFGCDICQDVCPWNVRAPVTSDASFALREFAPPLEKLAALSESEFREMFRRSPVKRTKYSGFLRNVAVAMGNSSDSKFRRTLERLASSEDKVVSEAARWALDPRPARPDAANC
jgi:epoxyqueuosine reductase